MSVSYTWVQWNRHKRIYDAWVAVGVVACIGVFIATSKLVLSGAHSVSDEVLVIRSLAACAFTLLHIILCIGPLARLSPLFAPLLYNRRHLGVTMFLLALAHALLATGYYGGFGVRNAVLAVLAPSPSDIAPGVFDAGALPSWLPPFETFGFVALLILFLMAATSHDFWLKNLTPRVWKTLHMLVYAAYALLILHVALGALQADRSLALPGLVMGGALLVGTLHIAAGVRERRRDTRGLMLQCGRGPHGQADPRVSEGWVDVCSVNEIPESRAKVVCLRESERVAVFKHEGTLSAVSNMCAHQGGPLGEGKIIKGCITCPWHGYQYLPASGTSPPPFTERVPTYRVRISHDRVLLDPTPLPPGTHVEPAVISTATEHEA